MTKRAEKIKHLKETALSLFLKQGYHATGVDTITAKAGVAKTTLYRHFPTKDHLIVAVLKDVDEAFRANIRAFVSKSSGDPKKRLLATFDFLQTWFEQEDFRGCPFLLAAAEYENRKSPVFQEALMHKRLMLAYFEELAHAASLKEPENFASALCLLHEGATANAHVFSDPKAARKAKDIARSLI